MKCAGEILAMRDRIVATQHDYYKNTVDYCEKVIAPCLERQAQRGDRVISGVFYTGAILDNKGSRVRLLESTGEVYADGTISQRPSDTYIDLIILKEYLEAHCYSVKYYEVYSAYKHYGLGTRAGTQIIVKLNPACK